MRKTLCRARLNERTEHVKTAVPRLRVSPLPPFPLALSSVYRFALTTGRLLFDVHRYISIRREWLLVLAPLRAGPFPPPFHLAVPCLLELQLTPNSPRSTPPKSPIILDDCVSHDEDAAATTGAGTLPTSLQDESAAAFDKTARRKRSLSADSLDKAAAASAVQVDALGAAVQVPVCEPLEMTISSAPPSPPPSSETPWKSVVTSSAPLPTPFVAISSPPTAPAPLPHQHQHRSAYPISSAAGFVQEASAVYHSLYSLAPYDLSPGFLPLPPPPSSSTTTATSATLASVAPFASSPSGLPEHYPDTFAPFPVPATTTLYYPISSGEPNRLVPSAAGYPLPPPTSSQATMETYLPSPPLSLHEAALFQAGHGRLHLAPGPGPGPIGQQQPMPWPTTTATAPPPRSPPRLVANGFTYPISSSSSPRAHFDPGLQVRAAPPPTVLWSKGALASFGATTKSSTTATTKTSGGANGGGGARRQVHEHGSPDWSALRQQIQAGEHPRSRGTCKFFNPQTVSFTPLVCVVDGVLLIWDRFCAGIRLHH